MTVNASGFHKFRRGMRAAFQEGTNEAAKDVVDLASQFAPKLSGNMAASGDTKPVPPARGAMASTAVTFGDDDDINYPQFVEYGNDNPNYPAQPFLGPALKEIDVAIPVAAALKRLERSCRVI